jgi:hypothetical protein
MLKKIFIFLSLSFIIQVRAMEKEHSLVPHFPKEIEKRIIHYLIALHHESDEEFIKRTATIPRTLFFSEKNRPCVSLHTAALAPSGNVSCRLEKSRYIDSDLWDIIIDIVELPSHKKLQKIYYQLAYDPLSIDFNIQGTKIIIHTSKGEPAIYSLYEEVQKLSTVQNNHLKMLILQKFFDQENC